MDEDVEIDKCELEGPGQLQQERALEEREKEREKKVSQPSLEEKGKKE